MDRLCCWSRFVWLWPSRFYWWQKYSTFYLLNLTRDFSALTTCHWHKKIFLYRLSEILTQILKPTLSSHYRIFMSNVQVPDFTENNTTKLQYFPLAQIMWKLTVQLDECRDENSHGWNVTIIKTFYFRVEANVSWSAYGE